MSVRLFDDASRSMAFPLPFEVTLMIFEHLHVNDVLNLRRVSKAMYSLTQTRDIWLSLYNSSYARFLRYPPRLEEPLSAYTTAELETLVTRRARQAGLWDSDIRVGTPEMKVHRAFTLKTRCENAILVRGGRWLLSVAPDARGVYACDLDAAASRARLALLCKPALLREEDMAFSMQGPDVSMWWTPFGQEMEVVSIDVDVVEDAPRLEFTLMMSLTLGYPRLSVLQFWKVSLVGHGCRAKLKATHLRTVVLPYLHDRQCLFGHYVVQEFPSRDASGISLPLSVRVIDWKQSTPSALSVASLSVERNEGDYNKHPTKMFVLPQHKLLCFTEVAAILYALPDCRLHSKAFFDPHLMGPKTTPLWRIKVPEKQPCLRSFSPLYHERNASRTLVATYCAIYELVIRHDGPPAERPAFSKVVDFHPNTHRTHMRYPITAQAAFAVCYPNGRFGLFYCPFDHARREEGDGTVAASKVDDGVGGAWLELRVSWPPDGFGSLVGCDVDSGRLMLTLWRSYDREMDVSVLETASSVIAQ